MPTLETALTSVALQMNHPNIMILYDFFAEDKYYYLVTEFMEGGELFDRIVEKVSFYLIVEEHINLYYIIVIL